jgi:hypothetical protein
MSKELHHANLIIGSIDNQNVIFDILAEDLNFKVQQNPDFFSIQVESFGIDDARDLERWSIGKPLIGDKKVAWLDLGSMTFESQNALLKVLEEPPLGTYFFIKIDNLGNVLPTLLSRVQILDLGNGLVSEGDKSILAKKFYQAGLKEKFVLIRNLTKKEDKLQIKNLIKDLEMVAYSSANKNQLKNILKAKVLTSVRGASPKMVLEWLACVL